MVKNIQVFEEFCILELVLLAIVAVDHGQSAATVTLAPRDKVNPMRVIVGV